MQNTSDLYKEILSGKHRKKTRLAIGTKDTPLAKLSTFFGEDALISMSTSLRVFSTDTPTVGSCVSGEVSVEMLKPDITLPRQAKLVPQVCITDGARHSEWLNKGVFFIDTRVANGEGTGVETLSLHGYDSMLKAEQDYPASSLQWPAKDIDVVKEIAGFIGVDIDARTLAILVNGYLVQYPAEYSCRETLGYIAAMYGGSFIMSDIGELRLVALNGMPPETNYLITEDNDVITFGGDRILV